MNRHTKIAILVAPILAIFGYALSDMYMESKAMEKRLFVLEPEAGFCDVIGKNCILRSGDFKVSLYQEDGLTTLNSTFPLDTATLFLVDDTGGVSPYQMGMKESPYYWFQKTAIEKVHANAGSKQLIRLILTIKGGQYVGEFLSTNVGDRVTVEKGSI